MDCYKGISTRVLTEGGFTSRIRMKVGVKQGDPLSPLLFRMFLTGCCIAKIQMEVWPCPDWLKASLDA